MTTIAPGRPEPDPLAPRPGRPRLPTLLVAVDISVLAVALPTMGRDLHASATELLWMTDSYNFMVAGAMLTAGAVADRIGRRRMILICAAIFAAASGIGAFATTPELVIARAGRDGRWRARRSCRRRWRSSACCSPTRRPASRPWAR